MPKEGSHHDLPIALGLLAAMGVLPASEMANFYVALGELSLDAAVTGTCPACCPPPSPPMSRAAA